MLLLPTHKVALGALWVTWLWQMSCWQQQSFSVTVPWPPMGVVFCILSRMLAGAQVRFGKIPPTMCFPKSCSLSPQQPHELPGPCMQSNRKGWAHTSPSSPTWRNETPGTLSKPEPTRAYLCSKLWGYGQLYTFSMLFFKPCDKLDKGKIKIIIMREPSIGKLISGWRRNDKIWLVLGFFSTLSAHPQGYTNHCPFIIASKEQGHWKSLCWEGGGKRGPQVREIKLGQFAAGFLGQI